MINKSKLMPIGIVTALLAGGSSLGFAQTAPTTGGSSADVYRLPNGAAAYVPSTYRHLYAYYPRYRPYRSPASIENNIHTPPNH
jgi:hypothetical protein